MFGLCLTSTLRLDQRPETCLSVFLWMTLFKICNWGEEMIECNTMARRSEWFHSLGALVKKAAGQMDVLQEIRHVFNFFSSVTTIPCNMTAHMSV